GVDLVRAVAGDPHPGVPGDAHHGDVLPLVVEVDQHHGVRAPPFDVAHPQFGALAGVQTAAVVGADHQEVQRALGGRGTVLVQQAREDVVTVQLVREPAGDRP